MAQKRKQLWIAKGLAFLLVLGGSKVHVCPCAADCHAGSAMASAQHVAVGHSHAAQGMEAGHDPRMAPDRAPDREARGEEQGRNCGGGECCCVSILAVDYYPKKAPRPEPSQDSRFSVDHGAIERPLDPPPAQGGLVKVCGPPPCQLDARIFVVNCAFLL